MDKSRREFLKRTALTGAAAMAVPAMGMVERAAEPFASGSNDDIILVKNKGLRITGTFLDEISHDIPHQNWGPKEWEQDFKYMKAMGIDTVIMIRSGYRKFITWPSKYLLGRGCYQPSMDLLELFLRLSDKYGMKFWFGLYDTGVYWDSGKMEQELETNKYVIDEVWKNYGHHKSFGGWYISHELGRYLDGAIGAFQTMGKQCKDISKSAKHPKGLPTFISPWIDGKKAVSAAKAEVHRDEGVSVDDHRTKWNTIFDGIHEYVDACAFQDGHIDYDELDAFFTVNKQLCDKYGIQCWTNAESFDRDMPIKFFPIKFDKLRLKLEAAKRCSYDKAITFEFSHFMSPQSAYLQAGHLYDRYKEYFG